MRVLTWIFVFVLGCSSVAAASPDTSLVRSAVPPRSQTPIADSLKSIAAQSMQRQVQTAPIIRHGSRRAPTLRALLIGAGVGFGLGAWAGYAIGHESTDERFTPALTVGAGAGLLGALVGYTISAR
jgi:hypothetical protein